MFYASGVLAQKIDTLYYDQELKVVEHQAFAHYYRIVHYPSNPNFPTRIRDFYMDGTLQSEGVVVHLDPYDDTKSIFKNTIHFYKNGQKAQECFYNQGQLHGVQISYYESGGIAQKIEYSNGVKQGIQQAFTESGAVIYDGIYEDDCFTGEYNEYEGDQLIRSAQVVHDLPHGKVLLYKNDHLVAEQNYKNGLLDGTSYSYDDFGSIVEVSNYVQGLPLGRSENREDGKIRTNIYKEIKCGDNSPIRISVTFKKANIPTGAISTSKSYGPLLIELAAVALGESTSTERETIHNRYVQFDYFDVYFHNDTFAHIKGYLSDIKVEYIRKNKAKEDNSAMPRNQLVAIFEAYAAATATVARENAEHTATAAATTSSKSTQASGSYSHQKESGKANANATGVIARGDAGVGYNTNGTGAAVIAARVGAAEGNYNANATKKTNQYDVARTSSTTSNKDGLLEYQIRQQESAEAEAKIQRTNSMIAQYADLAHYESFTIKPHELAHKWIGANREKKFDKVRLSFSLNGTAYSVEFDYETELKQKYN